MKVRLITSGLGIVVFFALLFSHVTIFHVADAIVAGIAIYEVFSVVGLTKKPSMIIAGILGIGLNVIFSSAHMGYIDYNISLLAIAVFIAYLFAVMVFNYKKVKFNDASMAFFSAVLLALLYSYIVPLRASEYGQYLIVALFAATWCNDAGAYFIGIRFGKHKLAPTLSPKKTVEGAIGGVLGCVLASLILYAVFVNFVWETESANYIAVALMSVFLSFISMCGDLTASVIKRNFEIKDFGKLIPGHGGILDRFDSIIFVLVALYAVLNIFGVVI